MQSKIWKYRGRLFGVLTKVFWCRQACYLHVWSSFVLLRCIYLLYVWGHGYLCMIFTCSIILHLPVVCVKACLPAIYDLYLLYYIYTTLTCCMCEGMLTCCMWSVPALLYYTFLIYAWRHAYLLYVIFTCSIIYYTYLMYVWRQAYLLYVIFTCSIILHFLPVCDLYLLCYILFKIS